MCATQGDRDIELRAAQMADALGKMIAQIEVALKTAIKRRKADKTTAIDSAKEHLQFLQNELKKDIAQAEQLLEAINKKRIAYTEEEKRKEKEAEASEKKAPEGEKKAEEEEPRSQEELGGQAEVPQALWALEERLILPMEEEEAVVDTMVVEVGIIMVVGVVGVIIFHPLGQQI